MDIMLPLLREQASPAPWLVRQERVDLPRLIERVLACEPAATVDEIVSQLASWNVQASGIIVAMWLMKRKNRPAKDGTEVQPGDAVPSTTKTLSQIIGESLWTSAT